MLFCAFLFRPQFDRLPIYIFFILPLFSGHLFRLSLVALYFFLYFLVIIIPYIFLLYLLLKSAENLQNEITLKTKPGSRMCLESIFRFSNQDVGCLDDVLPPVLLQTSIVVLSLCVPCWFRLP